MVEDEVKLGNNERGEIIGNWMSLLGWTQSALARRVDITRQTIALAIEGKAGRETYERLEEFMRRDVSAHEDQVTKERFAGSRTEAAKQRQVAERVRVLNESKQVVGAHKLHPEPEETGSQSGADSRPQSSPSGSIEYEFRHGFEGKEGFDGTRVVIRGTSQDREWLKQQAQELMAAIRSGRTKYKDYPTDIPTNSSDSVDVVTNGDIDHFESDDDPGEDSGVS